MVFFVAGGEAFYRDDGHLVGESPPYDGRSPVRGLLWDFSQNSDTLTIRMEGGPTQAHG
jgi:hypothetical protein